MGFDRLRRAMQGTTPLLYVHAIQKGRNGLGFMDVSMGSHPTGRRIPRTPLGSSKH